VDSLIRTLGRTPSGERLEFECEIDDGVEVRIDRDDLTEILGNLMDNPTRARKLLLHRREINKIVDEMAQKSLTLVPTRLYLKNGRAKVEVALARGKRKADKRADLAKKDANRQVERALREKYRY
jgi:SsrA-binding protein